jgi:hypothetical protein
VRREVNRASRSAAVAPPQTLAHIYEYITVFNCTRADTHRVIRYHDCTFNDNASRPTRAKYKTGIPYTWRGRSYSTITFEYNETFLKLDLFLSIQIVVFKDNPIRNKKERLYEYSPSFFSSGSLSRTTETLQSPVLNSLN